MQDSTLNLIGATFIGVVVKWIFDRMMKVARPPSSGGDAELRAEFAQFREDVDGRLSSIEGTLKGMARRHAAGAD